MRPASILNDVIGPIMRGPSSSHTAGPYHIGLLCRDLLGEDPVSATIAFDLGGSFAEVYQRQGSDLGFAAGLMGLPITDERFLSALDLADSQGLGLTFEIRTVVGADHPNTVEIELLSNQGRTLRVMAKSVGGGAVVISRLGDWRVDLTGQAHEILLICEAHGEAAGRRVLREGNCVLVERLEQRGEVLLHARSPVQPDTSLLRGLGELPEVVSVRTAGPVFLEVRGNPPFSSAEEMVALAHEKDMSLGRVGLHYESQLLGIGEDEVLEEVRRRWEVMRGAVERGLKSDRRLRLLRPAAASVMEARAWKGGMLGGIHTRAAARAMAVMEENTRGGVLCAAPTAGSAGVVPGVAVTLAEEGGLDQERIALGILAAGAIGVVIAGRATFAAEVAGCQVEIGASGAMASAMIVDCAGGTPAQAANAAAIAFQNVMGSTCDPVQGIVEIPCMTRNAAAASSAFVNADLVLGGYDNPIPLDETVDAVYAVGKMLPRELKCTALGGLSMTPSGKGLSPI